MHAFMTSCILFEVAEMYVTIAFVNPIYQLYGYPEANTTKNFNKVLQPQVLIDVETNIV